MEMFHRKTKERQHYESPSFSIVDFDDRDVLTSSGNSGEWDLNNLFLE